MKYYEYIDLNESNACMRTMLKTLDNLVLGILVVSSVTGWRR